MSRYRVHDDHKEIPVDAGTAEQIQPDLFAVEPSQSEDRDLQNKSEDQVVADLVQIRSVILLELLLEKTVQKDIQRRGEGINEDEPRAKHVAVIGEFLRKAADDDQDHDEQLDVIKFKDARF